MRPTDLPKPPRPRYRWRILLLAAVTLPLLAVGGWVGICLLDRLRGNWEVRAAVAEIENTDPGWTFDEILAARPPLADEENGARYVAASYALHPKEPPNERPDALPWHGEDPDAEEQRRQKEADELTQLRASIQELEPNFALDAKQLDHLRGRHKKSEAALREALKLADFPRGRYAIQWLPGPFAASLEPAYEGRVVIDLLEDEVRLRSHAGDAPGACRCARAMLHLGRYSDDEPNTSVYLTRLAELSIAAHAAERVLGQGQPAPQDLLTLQRLLEAADAGDPASLRMALRGDRAAIQRTARAYENGEIPSLQELESHQKPTLWGWLREGLLDVPLMRRGHALHLGMLTKWIGHCDRPPAEQAALAAKLERDVPNALRVALGHFVMSGYQKTSDASFRVRASLRCAAVLAATERYRQEKGAWPDSLDVLVPQYLARVPADPYDGQSLRLKRLPDGVVVYSVGPDLTDNGGTLDRQIPTAPGNDLGFQLWDVAHRGIPASKE
jgi:hypothetical protein